MRSRDIDEVIDAVSKVYCPHSMSITGRQDAVDSVLEIIPGPQPLVHLSHGAPVAIDAGDFSQLFLAIRATRGSGSAQQSGRGASWRTGQTLVFSAGLETRFQFDREFAQTSVRLDAALMEKLCGRWLGRPLDQPLRFDFRVFSEELEASWRHLLGLLAHSPPPERNEVQPRRLLDEYLLTVLLHGQPNNYSAELQRHVKDPSPRIVRRAEQLICDSIQAPMTVSDMAAELGVSIRSLQAAFRTWRSTTPSRFLRETRLRRVRGKLSSAGPSTSITEVALEAGFTHLGRFSAAYRNAYGESPRETLARSKRAFRRSGVRHASADGSA